MQPEQPFFDTFKLVQEFQNINDKLTVDLNQKSPQGIFTPYKPSHTIPSVSKYTKPEQAFAFATLKGPLAALQGTDYDQPTAYYDLLKNNWSTLAIALIVGGIAAYFYVPSALAAGELLALQLTRLGLPAHIANLIMDIVSKLMVAAGAGENLCLGAYSVKELLEKYTTKYTEEESFLIKNCNLTNEEKATRVFRLVFDMLFTLGSTIPAFFIGRGDGKNNITTTLAAFSAAANGPVNWLSIQQISLPHDMTLKEKAKLTISHYLNEQITGLIQLDSEKINSKLDDILAKTDSYQTDEDKFMSVFFHLLNLTNNSFDPPSSYPYLEKKADSDEENLTSIQNPLKLAISVNEVPDTNLLRIVFANTEYAKLFQGAIFNLGFGNPGMKDEPKKILPIPADENINNNNFTDTETEHYAIEVTQEEYTAIKSALEPSKLEQVKLKNSEVSMHIPKGAYVPDLLPLPQKSFTRRVGENLAGTFGALTASGYILGAYNDGVALASKGVGWLCSTLVAVPFFALGFRSAKNIASKVGTNEKTLADIAHPTYASISTKGITVFSCFAGGTNAGANYKNVRWDYLSDKTNERLAIVAEGAGATGAGITNGFFTDLLSKDCAVVHAKHRGDAKTRRVIHFASASRSIANLFDKMTIDAFMGISSYLLKKKDNPVAASLYKNFFGILKARMSGEEYTYFKAAIEERINPTNTYTVNIPLRFFKPGTADSQTDQQLVDIETGHSNLETDEKQGLLASNTSSRSSYSTLTINN